MENELAVMSVFLHTLIQNGFLANHIERTIIII